MRLRILLFLSFASIYLVFPACTLRKAGIIRATRAFQANGYVVVQTSPDRFLVLTKSNMTLEAVQNQLGCGKPHICSGQWNGQMWTIERLK